MNKKIVSLFVSIFLLIISVNVYAVDDEIIETEFTDNLSENSISFPVEEKEITKLDAYELEEIVLSEEEQANLIDSQNDSEVLSNNFEVNYDNIVNVNGIGANAKVVTYPYSTVVCINTNVDDKYIYYWVGSSQYSIYRYDINTNTFTSIYTVDSEIRYNILATNWSNGMFYILYQKSGQPLGLIAYDLKNSKEAWKTTYNTLTGSFAINESFAVDKNGLLYIQSSDSKSILTLDKNGNQLYSATYPDAYSKYSMFGPAFVTGNCKLLCIRLAVSGNLYYGYVSLNGSGKVNDAKISYFSPGMYGGTDALYNINNDYYINNYGEIYKLDYTNNKNSLIWTAYMTDSGFVSAYANGNYLYTKSPKNTIIKMNLSNFKIEKNYLIDSNAEIRTLKHYNNKLYVIYVLNSTSYCEVIDESALQNVVTNTYNSNTAMSHSKNDITNKYNELDMKFDYTQSIYEVEPVFEGNYSAGKIKQGALNDALNQLKLFRWVYGLTNNISLYEQFLERNQKGAVLLAASDQFSHYPSKPSDMSDEFFAEGRKGTGAGVETINGVKYKWEGNISASSSLAPAIEGYVDDHYNVNPDVGHRNSMLSLKAIGMSTGISKTKSSSQYRDYSTLSIFVSDNNNGNNDKFYTWPPSGYVLTEMVRTASMWSINISNLNADTANLGDFKIKYTVNGKSYTLTRNDVYYDSSSKVLYYDLPDDLKKALTDGNSRYLPGVRANVEITGLYDKSGNKFILNYFHEFFTNITTRPTKATFFIDNSMSSNSDGSIIYANKKMGKYKLSIGVQPYDVIDKRVTLTIEDPSIVSVNSNKTEIEFLKPGKTIIHIKSVYTGEEIGIVNVTSKPNEDGLYKIDGTWYYYKNGDLQSNYTGLVKKDGAWFYVQKGEIKWGVETLVKKDGTWFYVKNSTVDWSYTGLFKFNGTWYYIQKGVLQWGVETLVKRNGTWFYVKNSMVDWSYTGLFKKDGAWFYIQKGEIKWGVETLVKKDGTWFYVKNSAVDWSYTGLVKKDGTWFYVQKGVLHWGYNGTITWNGKNYTIKNSMVVN